jgi:hypothetical protein
MLREAGHHLAVVHAPAVLAFEILTQIATSERRCRTEPLIPRGIGVVVVNAKQEWIDSSPRKA